MSTRSRVAAYGSAGALVVGGAVCGAVIADGVGQVLAFTLTGLGLVTLISLVFLEIGLSEDRERAFARMSGWLGVAAKRPLLEGVRIALAAWPEDSSAAEIATTLPVSIAALVRTRARQEPVKPDASLTVNLSADGRVKPAHGRRIAPGGAARA